MPELVEVRFKGGRKDFFTWEAETTPTVGDAVVVEVERGRDLGRVAAVGETAERKCGVGCNGCGAGQPTTPTGKALRLASGDDTHLSNELRKAEEDVRRNVIERAQSHKLNIKVSDAEWQWDRKKLTIYFTAETRVDFPGVGSGPRLVVPYAHRTASDRCPGRGQAPRWRRALRTAILLLVVAPRAPGR